MKFKIDHTQLHISLIKFAIDIQEFFYWLHTDKFVSFKPKVFLIGKIF